MLYSIKLPFDQRENIWFTSDWHLYHANVIRFDNRPFKDIYQMNNTIIENHSKLTEKDHLFFLGDLTFKDCSAFRAHMSKLRCRKYFIYGNHDKYLPLSYLKETWDRVFYGYCELTVGKQKIVMAHYPITEWNGGHRGSWHLFGHTHGNDTLNPNIKTKKTKNVGCMLNDYKPFNYNDIEREFVNREDIKHH